MPFIASLGFLNTIGFCYPDLAIQQILYTVGDGYAKVFKYSDNLGRGTEYVNVPTATWDGTVGGAIDNVGRNLALSLVAAPYLKVFPWTDSGSGTQYSNPSTLPIARPFSEPAFHPQGTAIVLNTYSPTDLFTAYQWGSSGFGTKFIAPSLGTSSGYGYLDIKFSPDGSRIYVGERFSPFISCYSWSTSGAGTRYSDPSSLPLNAVICIAINKVNGDVVLGTPSTADGHLINYNFSSGWGTKATITLPIESGRTPRTNSLSFNKDCTTLAVGRAYSGEQDLKVLSVSGSTYTAVSGLSPPGNNGVYNVVISPTAVEVQITYSANASDLKTLKLPSQILVGDQSDVGNTATSATLAISNFT